MERQAASCILDCGNGVRLQGFLSENRQRSRGLVVLLHGWEGSARSTYILSATGYLLGQGYSVFRLNFRDHGDTQGLNEEVFHSCRLDEVVGAVAAITRRNGHSPLFLVGFSLGGNFALRIALEAPRARIPLRRVVSICPAIDPRNVLRKMEEGPSIYERYFMWKWRRSLRRKQELFPDRYDFEEWFRIRGMREATRYMIERHSEFPTLDAYLDGYAVGGARLAGLQVPTTIVAACDDPIIPVADLHGIESSASLQVELHARGGHCGFIDNFRLGSWIEPRIVSILSDGAEIHH